MLDSLIDAAKGQLVSHLTQQTGLQAEQAEQSVPLAKESITEGLTSAVSGGNIGGILDMIKGASGSAGGADSVGTGAGGLMQNAVYQGIAGNFINKLTSKLGIPASMAQTVSSYALPFIMSKLAGKTRAAGDTDEIDKGSLLSVLGLDAGGLLGKAGGLLGGSGNSDSEGDTGGSLGGALGGLLK